MHLAPYMFVSSFLVLAGSYGVAQQSPSTKLIERISTPEPLHALSKRDVSGLNQLRAYARIVGGGVSWNGMLGTGHITYDYTTSIAEGTAKVWLSGETSYRLDTDVQGVHWTVRSGPNYASSRRNDEQEHGMTMKQADAGFLLFQRLTPALMADPFVNVIDHGTADTGAGPMRRITVERPSPMLRASLKEGTALKAMEGVSTDFYFDPATNLLLRSAISFSGSGAMNEDMASVITYSDYQLVNGSMIPMRYSQAVNGQHVWTIQLDQVQLSETLNDTLFAK